MKLRSPSHEASLRNIYAAISFAAAASTSLPCLHNGRFVYRRVPQTHNLPSRIWRLRTLHLCLFRSSFIYVEVFWDLCAFSPFMFIGFFLYPVLLSSPLFFYSINLTSSHFTSVFFALLYTWRFWGIYAHYSFKFIGFFLYPVLSSSPLLFSSILFYFIQACRSFFCFPLFPSLAYFFHLSRLQHLNTFAASCSVSLHQVN